MTVTPPPGLYRVRHLLPRLAAHGIHTHRERLGACSDALGLDTRHGDPNAKRSWDKDQADFVIVAVRLWHDRHVQPDIVIELAQGPLPHPDPLIAELRRIYRRLRTNGTFTQSVAA